MSRQIPVTLTNMCMVRNGEYVLVQDRTDPHWPGITFPGGHIESGESFAASVIREVYEETGLTIENPRLCGVKEWENSDGSRYIVLLYKTDRFSGKIRSSHEGKVCWAALSSLPSLRLSLDFEKLLEVFLRDDLSEFYFEQTPEGWQDHLL
ncbi:MAG: 8-oxo-dGTP diphosphatase [Clostridiaceae bacterium]|nr:8-oxo-dGTP diphosphatase [Clostridia bacterium]MDY3869895.1 8-oxo-dGTP diphosphatase [Clostridiaceae bacterium]